MISSYDLLNEISDEKRFIKKVGGALLEVRNGVGDGLFTVSHSHIVSFMSRWEMIDRRPMFRENKTGILLVR